MSHVHQLAYSYSTSSAEISVIRTELFSVLKRKSRPASRFSFSRCCRLGRGCSPLASLLSPSAGRCRRFLYSWIRGSRRPACAKWCKISVARLRKLALSRRSLASMCALWPVGLRDWHRARDVSSLTLLLWTVLRLSRSAFLLVSQCAFKSLRASWRHLEWRSASRCGPARANLLGWHCSRLRCGFHIP